MTNLSALLKPKPLNGDRCQCRACGEYFNSTYAFDQNRKGKYTREVPFFGRSCLNQMEMHSSGWTQATGDYWRTPRKGAGPQSQRAQVRA